MGYRDIILADRPVAYWPLDGSLTPDLITSTLPTVSGTITSSPAPMSEGMSFASAQFDTNRGDEGCNPAAISVEIWAYPISVASSQCLMSKYTNGGQGEWILAGSTALYFELINTAENDYVYRYANVWTAGSWHHVVATTPGAAEPNMYIDGVLSNASGITPSGTRYTGLTGIAVTIGAFGGPAQEFDGSLCHAAIYNYVLTPEQIARHYQAGRRQVDISNAVRRRRR